jgi:hypothetical protein
VLADLAAHRRVREDLGEKLAVRSAYHRVRVGDDEDVDTVGLVLQGQPYAWAPSRASM